MNIKVYTLLLLLIASNAYWVFRHYQDEQINDALLESVRIYINKYTEANMHKEDRLYELEYNGRSLADSLYVTDIDGNRRNIKELINETKLILRYSDLNCHTCIDEQIKNLNKYSDSLGSGRILLFTTYQSAVYMRQFKKANKIKLPIYNLDYNASKKLKDIGTPYMFILSPENLKIQSMYVPQKEIPQLTDNYLKMIIEKY